MSEPRTILGSLTRITDFESHPPQTIPLPREEL